MIELLSIAECLLKDIVNTIIIATVTAVHGPRELAKKKHVVCQAVFRFQTIPPVIGIIPLQAELDRFILKKIQPHSELAADEAGPDIKSGMSEPILQIQFRTVTYILSPEKPECMVPVHLKIYSGTRFTFTLII